MVAEEAPHRPLLAMSGVVAQRVAQVVRDGPMPGGAVQRVAQVVPSGAQDAAAGATEENGKEAVPRWTEERRHAHQMVAKAPLAVMAMMNTHPS